MQRTLRATTHNAHKRQTFIPPAGFEPPVPASKRLQALTLGRASSGTSHLEINNKNWPTFTPGDGIWIFFSCVVVLRRLTAPATNWSLIQGSRNHVWSRNIKRCGLGPIWAVALQQEKCTQNDRCITGLYNYLLQRSIFKFQRNFSTDFFRSTWRWERTEFQKEKHVYAVIFNLTE